MGSTIFSIRDSLIPRGLKQELGVRKFLSPASGQSLAYRRGVNDGLKPVTSKLRDQSSRRQSSQSIDLITKIQVASDAVFSFMFHWMACCISSRALRRDSFSLMCAW